MRISLVVNPRRSDAVEAAQQVATSLVGRGIEVGVEPELADQFGLPGDSVEAIAASDIAMSFGGDGTLIRTAHAACISGIPVLGIYFGSFGFVTQATSLEIGAILSMVLDGKAPIEERMMLQTDLMRNGKSVATMHSLNETVLQRAVTSRMMVFDVMIDGLPIASYPADGVLISTPTGSTAYNLSAGGPIVDPKMRAMMLTALAPHTLNARTLVLRAEAEITLGIQSVGDAVLSVDGQTKLHLLTGDQVQIKASPLITRLVCVERQDFLEKLSNRLFYGVNASYGSKP